MKIVNFFWTVAYFRILVATGDDTTEVDYHASLIIDGASFCAGTLIDESFILTTAKCVYGSFEVGIALNLDDLLQPSDITFVATPFVIHEDFRPDDDDSTYNIALIKIPTLDKALYDIHLLALPRPPHNNPPIQGGDELQLSGFNKEHLWGSQEVMASAATCQGSPFLFCIVGQRADYRNYGSPVFDQNDVLLGIIVNIEEDDESLTYVLTIELFLDWIQAKMTAN